MHHIADVKIVYPVILMLNSQNISHVQFELMIEFKKIYIGILMERYFQCMLYFLFLSLEHLVSFLFTQLVNTSKFLDDSLEFINNGLHFHNDIFNDFGFLFNIVHFITCIRCLRVYWIIRYFQLLLWLISWNLSILNTKINLS